MRSRVTGVSAQYRAPFGLPYVAGSSLSCCKIASNTARAPIVFQTSRRTGIRA